MLRLRLKELRARDNVTQEQLALAIGVERSSIGKYEGKQSVVPSVDVLKSIADYFNVTTDYLLGRAGLYEQLSNRPDRSPDRLFVAESAGEYAPSAFDRAEFKGLTQNEIEKLAIYAEGLKGGRPE